MPWRPGLLSARFPCSVTFHSAFLSHPDSGAALTECTQQVWPWVAQRPWAMCLTSRLSDREGRNRWPKTGHNNNNNWDSDQELESLVLGLGESVPAEVAYKQA